MNLFLTIFGAIVCSRLFLAGVSLFIDFAVSVISESKDRD